MALGFFEDNPLPTVAGYLCLFISLLSFAGIAVVATGFKVSKILSPDEGYLSARGTQNWWTLGLSLYASMVGSWVLYLPPYMGAMGSWVPAIFYALTCGISMGLIAVIGPIVSSLMSCGFTSADYMRERFNIIPQVALALLSAIVTTLNLANEFTCIARALGTLTNSGMSTEAIIITVSVITVLYTAYAGLPASIYTDKFQAILVVLCFVIILPVGFSSITITSEGWSEVDLWTSEEAWISSLNLFVSMAACELVNQGSWQRVFAAKSMRDLRKSYTFAIALTTATVFVFGITGICARAAYPTEYNNNPEEFNGVAFFILLNKLNSGWLGLTAILAICLAASSADTFQSALGALVGFFLQERGMSMNWARLVTLLLNVPAVIIALQNADVLKLYLLTNALILSITGPVLLSFWAKTTCNGVMAGSVAGILSMIVYGWIVTGQFVEGLLYPFPDSPYTVEYLGMLLTIPVVTTTTCVLCSLIEGYFRPHLLENELERRRLLTKVTQRAGSHSRSTRSLASGVINSIIGSNDVYEGDAEDKMGTNDQGEGQRQGFEHSKGTFKIMSLETQEQQDA